MIVICIYDNLVNFTLNKQYNVNRSIHSKLTDILYYEIKDDKGRICFEGQKNFITLKDYRRTKLIQIQNL